MVPELKTQTLDGELWELLTGLVGKFSGLEKPGTCPLNSGLGCLRSVELGSIVRSLVSATVRTPVERLTAYSS